MTKDQVLNCIKYISFRFYYMGFVLSSGNPFKGNKPVTERINFNGQMIKLKVKKKKPLQNNRNFLF